MTLYGPKLDPKGSSVCSTLEFSLSHLSVEVSYYYYYDFLQSIHLNILRGSKID